MRECGVGWMLRVAFVLLASVTFGSPRDLPAQEVSQEVLAPGDALYEFHLRDGSVLIARVVAVRGAEIDLVTAGGLRLTLERGQIAEYLPIEGRVVDGRYWPADQSATRLFVGTTARSLSRGEAYLGTHFILLPFVALGITDRLSVAAGAPLLLGRVQPFYIAPKLQIVAEETFKLAVGGLAVFYNDENVGVLFAMSTIGTDHRAIHVGVGWGVNGNDYRSEPVATIGGEVRVGQRIKLLTENYFLPGERGAIVSGGMRFIGDRLSADLGIAGASSFRGFECCLPLVNFSFGFGRP